MTHTARRRLVPPALAGLAVLSLEAARAGAPGPVAFLAPPAAGPTAPAWGAAAAGRPGGLVLFDTPGLPPAAHEVPPTFIETAARQLIGKGVDVDSVTPGDTNTVPRPPGEAWADGAPLLLFDWSGASADQRAAQGLRQDGDKRVAKASAELGRGDLSSKVTVRERDEALLDPTRPRSWETDETVKVPVAGPLFLYGNLGASSPSVEQQSLKWRTKTGVGVKLRPWLLDEVQVKGGSAVRYDDTSGTAEERSELFLEVTTKVPLPVLGPVNVEYSGVAVPALTPADRDRVNQDVKLAKPLRGGNEFHLGARYWSEDVPAPAPWVDRMQLYMGLQLKR